MTARLALCLMLFFNLAWNPACAQDEVPNATDHPLIQRFEGSRLIGYRQSDWEETFFPTQNKNQGSRWLEPQRAEGRLTRLVYLAPAGKSRAEVHRNYEQALMAAGLKKRFSCEQRCDSLYGTMANTLAWRDSMRFAQQPIRSADGRSNFNASAPLSYDEVRFLYGTLNRSGAEWHVLVLTTQAVNNRTDAAATFIQIIEPKAMQTGQVVVNANALQGGLASQGHVVVDGLLFDTGKATLRSESQTQLDELAALLKSQPQWKVYIVGHTDNVGSLDANLALSQARAESVVEALQRQGIAPARVLARSVASLAPKASNADEAGRARNRRVELVLQ